MVAERVVVLDEPPRDYMGGGPQQDAHRADTCTADPADEGFRALSCDDRRDPAAACSGRGLHTEMMRPGETWR